MLHTTRQMTVAVHAELRAASSISYMIFWGFTQILRYPTDAGEGAPTSQLGQRLTVSSSRPGRSDMANSHQSQPPQHAELDQFAELHSRDKTCPPAQEKARTYRVAHPTFASALRRTITLVDEYFAELCPAPNIASSVWTHRFLASKQPASCAAGSTTCSSVASLRVAPATELDLNKCAHHESR